MVPIFRPYLRRQPYDCRRLACPHTVLQHRPGELIRILPQQRIYSQTFGFLATGTTCQSLPTVSWLSYCNAYLRSSDVLHSAFALPDGTVFIVANNQSIIYDIETNTETPLPDIPNGVRVTNPIDGSAILLPLSPPNFTPEVLVCGGSTADTSLPSTSLSSQHPATNQCSRITLTPEGIKAGWQVEHMLEARMMPELVHLPNGQVLITNGAGTGFAAISSVGDPVGGSNADHPVLTPSLYTPNAPLGQRISNAGLPTTDIPRMYHSTVTLTPQGNFLIMGNNPNQNFTPAGTPGIKFPSELRVETLDPPFMSRTRPSIHTLPETLRFGQKLTVPITIPSDLKASQIQGASLRQSV